MMFSYKSLDITNLTFKIPDTDTMCLMMPSPMTSYTLNVTKTEKARDHRQMAARLGHIEAELLVDLGQDSIEPKEELIPSSLWNELLKLSPSSGFALFFFRSLFKTVRKFSIFFILF